MDSDYLQAIGDIKKMDRYQLSLVDHSKHTLECCVEGCRKYWNVKDFGISPWFLIRGKWYDLLNANYSCDKHFKLSKDFPPKKDNCIQRLKLKNASNS